MTGKGREVADLMERRGVDILCVQETRWKGERARCIGAGYKMWCCGSVNKKNGVGIILKKEQGSMWSIQGSGNMEAVPDYPLARVGNCLPMGFATFRGPMRP